MPGRSLLVPTHAFAGLTVPAAQGRGVVVSVRDGLGLATVLVRKGKRAALAERVRQNFGIELPNGALRAVSGDVAWAGTGVGAWLATHDTAGNAFAAQLRHALGDVASVSDQSDGYAVLRLSGPNIRDALCKLVPVDLHPRAFPIGQVAVTMAAHIGTTLWRLEDSPERHAVYELVLFRSLAASLWHALCESAAEFGLEMRIP